MGGDDGGIIIANLRKVLKKWKVGDFCPVLYVFVPCKISAVGCFKAVSLFLSGK